MCSGRVVRRGRWLKVEAGVLAEGVGVVGARWFRRCRDAATSRSRRLLPLRLRRLQPVAQRHQFIDLGDDAVLFGEGWERQGEFIGVTCELNPRLYSLPEEWKVQSLKSYEQKLDVQVRWGSTIGEHPLSTSGPCKDSRLPHESLRP